MSLPRAPRATATVELSVGTVEITSLTIGQVQAMQKTGDTMALGISFATGVPLDEVKAWIDEIPAGDSLALQAAIVELSGLGEGAQKSG